MRDFALLAMVLALCWLALLRPWLGLLGLAVLGYMQPQGYATGFMRQAPVFMVLFGVTFLGALYHTWRNKVWAALPWRRLMDWRLLGLLGLWLWFGVTSYNAVAPWEAWPKYFTVLKILPPFLLALLLIDSREKLYYLVVTIALSILLVAIKGGYWAVISGFQDRVYGPPGSAYGDNNAFAVVVAMTIPLIVLWLRDAKDRSLSIFLLIGIAIAYASAVSSWSRGGMLTLGCMTLVMVWHSKRKFLVIPLLLGLLALLFMQLPEQWFGRMESVATYQDDQSAQGRLAAWRAGLDFVAKHPLTGGGFNAWPALTAGGLDWHSAYVEMLTEHGYVGLIWWSGLLGATLLSLTWNNRHYPAWSKEYGAMLQASLIAYLVGGITLGIAYWELPYHLIVLSVLLSVLSRPQQENTR